MGSRDQTQVTRLVKASTSAFGATSPAMLVFVTMQLRLALNLSSFCLSFPVQISSMYHHTQLDWGCKGTLWCRWLGRLLRSNLLPRVTMEKNSPQVLTILCREKGWAFWESHENSSLTSYVPSSLQSSAVLPLPVSHLLSTCLHVSPSDEDTLLHSEDTPLQCDFTLNTDVHSDSCH